MILDTNIWIYIAESIGEAKVVPELVRLHAAGTIDLILLQTVLEEFDRNKSRVASKYYQRYSGVISSAKALKHLDGTPADFDVALDLCRKALDIAKQSIPKSVTAIEKLFASLIIFETTDTHRLEAFRRLYERRAPAHNAKVSTPGDCLIWECVLQNLRRGEVAFCTANKADFSNPVNEGELHPDLRTEAERRAYQLSYHVSVEALLDRIGAQESIKRSVASAAVRDRRLARAYQNIENYFAEGKHRPWLGLAVCDSCGEHTVPIASQGKPTKCYYCKCRYSAPEQCVRCAAWVLDGLRETGICRVCFDDLLLAEH